MKKLIMIFSLLLMSISAKGQSNSAFCKDEALKSAFKLLLANLPQNFTFLKSYSAAKYYRGGKAWYSLTSNLDVPNNIRKDFILANNNRLRRSNVFTLILSKGNMYWIGVSEKESSKGIEARLCDSIEERKKKSVEYHINQELATNYINGTFYKGFYFKCTATGVYFLSIVFSEDTQSTWCGAAILALKTKHE